MITNSRDLVQAVSKTKIPRPFNRLFSFIFKEIHGEERNLTLVYKCDQTFLLQTDSDVFEESRMFKYRIQNGRAEVVDQIVIGGFSSFSGLECNPTFPLLMHKRINKCIRGLIFMFIRLGINKDMARMVLSFC